MEFRHETIDPEPPCGKLGFCLTVDLTGNGLQDVVVGGWGEGFRGRGLIKEAERRNIPTLRTLRSFAGFAETNLFWYENPGFERHDVAVAPYLDVGAAVGDITRDGRPNVVAGQGLRNNDVYWFEVPADPRTGWTKHLITDRFEKYHDLVVADVDGDAEQEVVGISQESETIFYYEIPADPYQAPWPDEYLHVVDEGREVEGIEVVDLDGDGARELIAGTSVYRRNPSTGGSWEREPIVSEWDKTRVAVADLDQDDELEVVFAEGDSPEHGSHPGRVAWFDQPEWECSVLKDGLFCPHSLQVADFSGNGLPDVYVAEMGLGKHDNPRHFLFRNDGRGAFDCETIATGIETHEAKAVDMTGDGRPDIVGKSYGPDHHVDIWYNEE